MTYLANNSKHSTAALHNLSVRGALKEGEGRETGGVEVTFGHRVKRAEVRCADGVREPEPAGERERQFCVN